MKWLEWEQMNPRLKYMRRPDLCLNQVELLSEHQKCDIQVRAGGGGAIMTLSQSDCVKCLDYS